MNPSAQRMDAALFDLVAVKCKWSDRSLGVAKLLIVEGVSLSEAAAAHQMSPQQANVIRGRFLAKADKHRVEEFMAREKPKLSGASLEPFSFEIKTLHEKGYTIEQIVVFLKENGVSTSPKTVRNSLRNITK
jgi:hypothetical protein